MKKKILEKIKDRKYSIPIIIILFIAAFLIILIDNNKETKAIPNIINIEATAAQEQDAPIYLTGLGTITPSNTSNIQPQVTGQILEIIFSNGQLVKKNDILVEIDPSLYKAQIIQYQGQLETNKALLNNALIDLKRYQDLWKENSISNQTLATQVSLVEQYKGNVKNVEGLLKTANINLAYCTIRAPFDGIMGIDLIKAGNIVNSSSVIAIINSLSPIQALFTLPQSNLPEVLEEFNKKTANKEQLLVELYDNHKKNIIASGVLVSIDNQFNTATGTIQLEAQFDNKDNKLYPNQFVNVKLLLKTLKNMIIIPSSAIQYGPHGSFVYLIEDGKAKINPVEINNLSGSNAVIAKGLVKDQQVATAGIDKLSDGSLVSTSN